MDMDTSTLEHGRRQGNPNRHSCSICGDISDEVEYCFIHADYVCSKKECIKTHKEQERKTRVNAWTRSPLDCYWHRA